jgi:hypothetical protein
MLKKQVADNLVLGSCVDGDESSSSVDYNSIPHVKAGKNTSTVIPASRKRRREGNPVVSDETVMYGYEPSATLTTDRLHYKLQTRPLVREGAPRRRTKQLSGKTKGKSKIWSWAPKGVPNTKTY